MDTQGIISLIIGGLLLFVVAGFAIHTIEHNRRERQRMEAILRKKASSLHYMLNHFPVNFLGSDLQVLICKSLQDVYEQLSQLTSRDKSITDHMTIIGQRLQKLTKNSVSQSHQPLENMAQIQEIKGLLNLLHNFIGRLQGEGSISREQGESYTQQLRMLLTQTTVDSYAIGARQAESNNKPRLAVHYYRAALDKLKKQNMDSMYHEHMIIYQQRIEALQEVINSQPIGMEEETTDHLGEEQGSEWDNFMEEDIWKKKNVYD